MTTRSQCAAKKEEDQGLFGAYNPFKPARTIPREPIDDAPPAAPTDGDELKKEALPAMPNPPQPAPDRPLGLLTSEDEDDEGISFKSLDEDLTQMASGS